MATNASRSPQRIGVLVYNGFQALDVYGPLDALGVVATQHHLDLLIIAPTLEPISTACSSIEHPTQSPNFAHSIVPTHTIDSTVGDIDVLIVPGGLGTRDEKATEPIVNYIKSRLPEPTLRYILSVCTGSLLVARTGQFNGHPATTNKKAFKYVRDRYPEVRWKEKARWVEGEKWWSSSGISAGTDMTLQFISQIWGEGEAYRVESGLEWTRRGREDDPWAAANGLGLD